MVSLNRDYKKLADELISRGLIQADELLDTIRLQKQSKRPLPELLLERGLVTEDALRAARAASLKMPEVDLKQARIDIAALRYVPEPLARRYTAVPLGTDGHSLRIAMAMPEDLHAIQDLQAHAGMPVQVYVANATDIVHAIDLHYKATDQLAGVLKGQPNDPVAPAEAPAVDEAARSPAVRAVELLLLQAIRDRASDIHIEPQADRVRVRYRIDGVLQEIVSLPSSIHSSLISRIKILAKMNIAEHRVPQDGQFTFGGSGTNVDVRVAAIETAHGERLVMRILDKSSTLLEVSDLGFSSEGLERFRGLLRVPYGMILVSGPTGSGKTTTLYAALNSMDRQTRNVVTIEDPIEYRLPDINQIQVNVKANLTFASGLRALMRHDPNVILIGEIRDPDTAQTAVQAALTGHLVLSTIHANNAASVVARLTNLGVDPFLVASSVAGVLAQRMVRRICRDCRITTEPTAEERLIFSHEMGAELGLGYKGAGCQFCSGTGFRGRIGVFELMNVTERLRQVLLRSREPLEVQREAAADGMVPLLRDGMLKAQQGVTSVTEVIRTLYSPI